jgi:hypothetical protein
MTLPLLLHLYGQYDIAVGFDKELVGSLEAF